MYHLLYLGLFFNKGITLSIVKILQQEVKGERDRETETERERQREPFFNMSYQSEILYLFVVKLLLTIFIALMYRSKYCYF